MSDRGGIIEAGDDNLEAVLQKARWQRVKLFCYFERVKKIQLLVHHAELTFTNPSVSVINHFLGNVLSEITNNSDILQP